MIKHLTLLMFIFLAFWSCASTSDDAIRQQENFIKNHPTLEGHPLNFEKRKPELNALEILEKINNSIESLGNLIKTLTFVIRLAFLKKISSHFFITT